ncbi:Phosphoenolpyruvate phosphatase [Halotydeus destructor]|nr:Phosphoenolpyruvate phosphatase [Halotydeus destructor]
MVVSWATVDNPAESSVQYGLDPDVLERLVMGTRRQLNTLGRVEYFHEAVLVKLEAKTKYFYRVGSKDYRSQVFNFTSYPSDDDVSWSPSFAIFGDMGTVNAKSLPSIMRSMDTYDMIIHLGDIAYDLFSFQGRTGDEYMRMIEPLAAHVPYTVLPGNHEYLPAIGDNGRNFQARFAGNKAYNGNANQHTFVLGPARFIAINSEVYFLSEGGTPARAHNQINWLRDQLKIANSPAERARRPWVIILQHRPVYCSSAQFGRCPGGQSWIRQGNVFFNFPGLEDLFKHYAVDLVFSGHNHHYERSLPVYDKLVRVGDTGSPYHKPKAPVYIVSGAPGNQEISDQGESFSTNLYEWSIVRSREIGYTRMRVFNGTHLNMQQIAAKDDSLIDDLWITK